MRLRLIVKRWGLPDTPFVLAVDTDTSPIISQLLEQVNEVVPIESGDWGFEDYAVEIQGKDGTMFECIHFHPVKAVMKEDDVVVSVARVAPERCKADKSSIRPLLTQDLKFRRLSGRHQITSAGSHLVDGVVFGRARMRLLDRPAINIPPRKKRRTTADDSTDDSESVHWELAADSASDPGKELVVRGEDIDDDDMDDDDDFEPEESTDEESSSQSDEADDEDDSDMGKLASKQKKPSKLLSSSPPTKINLSKGKKDRGRQRHDGLKISKDASVLEDIEDAQERNSIAKLRDAFPKAPIEVIKNVFQALRGDELKTYDTLKPAFKAAVSRSSIKAQLPTSKKLQNSTEKATTEKTSLKRKLAHIVESEDDDEESPSPSSVLRHYDQNGFPPGSIGSTAKSSAKKVKFAASDDAPLPQISDSETSSSGTSDSNFSSGTSSDEDTSSDSDSEETSSSGSDDTSSSGDSSKSTSEDSSDSTSDEDGDEPEELPSKAAGVTAAEHKPKATEPRNDNETGTKPPRSAPGTGKQATQARNSRRRKANALARYKAKGILPVGTTLAEFAAIDCDQLGTKESAAGALKAAKTTIMQGLATDTSARAADFEARRQQLLSSIAGGGIDVTSKPSTANDSQKASESTVMGDRDSQKLLHNDEATPDMPSSESHRRSGKSLDLGASRRMLFGAMGLKTPKNKQEEIKLRSQLKQQNNTERAPILIDTSSSHDEATDKVDLEAWRASINYTAVECCEEGIELTEPPFPFIQRWDPQQKTTWSANSSKRAKRKRGSTIEIQPDEDGIYNASVQKKGRKNRRAAIEQENTQDLTLDYSEPITEDPTGSATDVNRDEIGDNVEISRSPSLPDWEIDLPSLPDNSSALPDFKFGAAQIGTIIVFKQLEMTATWEPVISAFQTARVVDIVKDGETLSLEMATRDHKVVEKQYDEFGDRVYGKFEAPDFDDGPDNVNLAGESDDNLKLVAYSDLIEPKILVSITTQLDHKAPSGEQKSEHSSLQQPSGRVSKVIIDDSVQVHYNKVSHHAAIGENVNFQMNSQANSEAPYADDAAVGSSRLSEDGQSQDAQRSDSLLQRVFGYFGSHSPPMPDYLSIEDNSSSVSRQPSPGRNSASNDDTVAGARFQQTDDSVNESPDSPNFNGFDDTDSSVVSQEHNLPIAYSSSDLTIAADVLSAPAISLIDDSKNNSCATDLGRQPDSLLDNSPLSSAAQEV